MEEQFLKDKFTALACVAHLVGDRPMHQEVTGSIRAQSGHMPGLWA